jgi:GNAT superfamily N-acetyltransferase
MRCWPRSTRVSDLAIVPASVDDARAIARRRRFDDAAFRLVVELADRGTVWVARDDGEIVGIAVAHASDDERYVGDLFVEPSFRDHGVGGRLLDAAFADAGDAARTILLDPSEPAGLALALRRGCAVAGSIVRVAGAIPKEEELAAMAAGNYRFHVEPLDPEAHAYGVNALDRQTRGTTRPGDHDYVARAASGQAFFLNGEFVAYAYVWPDGRVGPLASASPAYLVQIFAFALVTLVRRHHASWCTALIPGSNLRIARAAMRAGLRIEQTFSFAADAAQGDPSTYVGYHTLLY